MSKRKNPTAVRLLKRVRERLASDRYGSLPTYQYICVALGNATRWHINAEIVAVWDIRERIALRLSPYGTLEEWLAVKGYLPQDYGKGLTNKQRERCQATRLAWIDSLIEEYS